MSDDVPGGEPYELEVRGAIGTWLSEENPSTELKQSVDKFLQSLCANPLNLGAVTLWPVNGLPVYSTIIPGTDIQVAWEVVKSPPYSLDNRRVIVSRIAKAPVD
jgi:hypothetical protein